MFPKWREPGGGGRLFEGGDYFKYFGQMGAIIRGRRLIEGRLLFKEILCTLGMMHDRVELLACNDLLAHLFGALGCCSLCFGSCRFH